MENENGKATISRLINIVKEFLKGDSYSPVGCCLTEVPAGLLMEEFDGYTMRQRGKQKVKKKNILLVDNF